MMVNFDLTKSMNQNPTWKPRKTVQWTLLLAQQACMIVMQVWQPHAYVPHVFTRQLKIIQQAYRVSWALEGLQ